MQGRASKPFPASFGYSSKETMTITEAVRKHTDTLMGLPGVERVGEGELYGKACIVVFVAHGHLPTLRSIPTNLEGYEVVVRESGRFIALYRA